MKTKWSGWGIVGLFAFFLCSCEEKPRVVVVEPSPTMTPQPPQATATPTPVQAQVAPPPAKQGLYLARRISITTDTGIYGFAPGTELELLSRKGGDTLVVRAQGMVIEVKESDTTTDGSAFAAPTPAAGSPAQQAGPATIKPAATTPTAAEVGAAKQALRQKIMNQFDAQIAALKASRIAIQKQLYAGGRDPHKSPEGRARLDEIERIGQQMDELYKQRAAALRATY